MCARNAKLAVGNLTGCRRGACVSDCVCSGVLVGVAAVCEWSGPSNPVAGILISAPKWKVSSMEVI